MKDSKKIIAEIYDCAVLWNSSDADYPNTPPKKWQKVLPLMESAPELLNALISLRDDMEMLKSGAWVPDDDSCDASIDLANLAIDKATVNTSRFKNIKAGLNEAIEYANRKEK